MALFGVWLVWLGAGDLAEAPFVKRFTCNFFQCVRLWTQCERAKVEIRKRMHVAHL